MLLRPPLSTRTDTLFPYTTLFRSREVLVGALAQAEAAIDFPDEDLPAGLDEAVRGRIVEILDEISRHLADNRRGERSEEHTSELQSLMRSSYAVFCLTKKKKHINKIKKNYMNQPHKTNA